MALKSKVLAEIRGLRHGFGTLAENIPSCLEPEWSTSRANWKQVHGIAFQEVIDPLQNCGEVDAFLSRSKKIPIAVMTADCVPVLFAKIDGTAIAAVHAGWRGTLAGATLNIWNHLKSQGEQSSNWVAAIGPAIGPCCYEVTEDLIQDFKQQKPNLEFSVLSPSFRKLDLPGIHLQELKTLGFKEVDSIQMCTRCHGGLDAPTFHSYRREQNKNRQYSGLMIT